MNVKGHKLRGEARIFPEEIIIDDGEYVRNIRMSNVSNIKFQLNEYEGKETFVYHPIWVDHEHGIYNYIEITSPEGVDKQEFMLTRKDIERLNILFDMLEAGLGDRLSIYQKGKKVKRLTL